MVTELRLLKFASWTLGRLILLSIILRVKIFRLNNLVCKWEHHISMWQFIHLSMVTELHPSHSRNSAIQVTMKPMCSSLRTLTPLHKQRFGTVTSSQTKKLHGYDSISPTVDHVAILLAHLILVRSLNITYGEHWPYFSSFYGYFHPDFSKTNGYIIIW